MTDSHSFKFIIMAFLMGLMYCQANVLARPNSKYDSGRALNNNVLQRSHKGKRAWDLPLVPLVQEEPVLSLLEEAELDKVDVSAELSTDIWLDISRDFLETKQLSRNSDGELVCEAVGSPPPKVYWLRNGLPVESMTVVTNDESIKNRLDFENNVILDKLSRSGMANVKSKLPIKCAQPEDEGHYTCVAINRGKQVSATTYLSVIDEDSKAPRGSCEYRLSMFSLKKSKKGSSPLITSSQTFHMETMGRHVALPCRSTGKPRSQTTWLDAEGKKVISGKKYQVSSSGSLIIRNLAWKDMGVYTCIVENSFGRDTITTFVYPMAEETEES